ncbi:Uncharacterised protein [Mycobacteroides abscessus subsp. massiliense]|nr:Uncharacterised protein [Mycobacteroides abscessus subsp. massiliense]
MLCQDTDNGRQVRTDADHLVDVVIDGSRCGARGVQAGREQPPHIGLLLGQGAQRHQGVLQVVQQSR